MKKNAYLVLSLFTLLVFCSCEIKHSIKIKNSLEYPINVKINGRDFGRINSDSYSDIKDFKNGNVLYGAKLFEVVLNEQSGLGAMWLRYDGLQINNKLMLTFCRDAKGRVQVEMTNPFSFPIVNDDLAREDWNEFYNKFITEKDFQLSRIAFPIMGGCLGGGADEVTKWSKDNWVFIETKSYLDFNDNCKDCIIESTKSDTLMTQTKEIKNTNFYIIQKFKCINNKWFMITRDESYD